MLGFHRKLERGLLPLIATILLVLPGCTTSQRSDKNLSFVTLEQAQDLVAGERSVFGGRRAVAWVDARTRADYDAGHIPNAISLPFERATQDAYLLDEYKAVVVYGADYNDARANGMSKRLQELLSDLDVRTFDGGVRAWTAAGHELQKTE